MASDFQRISELLQPSSLCMTDPGDKSKTKKNYTNKFVK